MRIALELYAERLARHVDRLQGDVDGARMRTVWAGLERRARADLGSGDAALLDAVGAFTGADEAGERRLVERRGRQLAALRRLQAIVEAELERARAAEQPYEPERASDAGAIDARSPPSSS